MTQDIRLIPVYPGRRIWLKPIPLPIKLRNRPSQGFRERYCFSVETGHGLQLCKQFYASQRFSWQPWHEPHMTMWYAFQHHHGIHTLGVE